MVLMLVVLLCCCVVLLSRCCVVVLFCRLYLLLLIVVLFLFVYSTYIGYRIKTASGAHQLYVTKRTYNFGKRVGYNPSRFSGRDKLDGYLAF